MRRPGRWGSRDERQQVVGQSQGWIRTWVNGRATRGPRPSGARPVRESPPRRCCSPPPCASADDGDGAEERAVAAFRAARDAGRALGQRTRRRDDWRPREQRRARPLVLRTTARRAGREPDAGRRRGRGDRFGRSDDGRRRRPAADARPSSTAGSRSGPTPRARRHPPRRPARPRARPHRPATRPAEDTEAHCRAYEAVKGPGQGARLDGLAATHRRRRAARSNVDAYCAGQCGPRQETGQRQGGNGSDKAAGAKAEGRRAGTRARSRPGEEPKK